MTTMPPATPVVEQGAAQQEVKEMSKQLKVLDTLSTFALPVSALVSLAALAIPLLPIVGVGAAVASAATMGVTKFLLAKKQSEMRDRIKRLVEEMKLPHEQASRLLSEVNRVTTTGQSS